MAVQFLPPRVHAWLDETVLPLYVGLAYALSLHGAALALVLYCAAQHFAVTRITTYPRGTWHLMPFPVHARFDLAEGFLLLAGAGLLTGESTLVRAVIAILGVAQVGAFAFSDTRWPPPERAAAVTLRTGARV